MQPHLRVGIFLSMSGFTKDAEDAARFQTEPRLLFLKREHLEEILAGGNLKQVLGRVFSIGG